MDEPSTELIAGLLIGTLFGALYSATVAGLNALGEARLHALITTEGPHAQLAARLAEHPYTIRARMIVGRVLCVGVVAGCAGGMARHAGVGAVLGSAALAALVYGVVAEGASAIARRRASRGTLRWIRWMRPLELLVAPFALPTVAVGTLVLRFVRQPQESADVEAKAVEHLIERGEERGAIEEDHAQLLRSVLEFKDTIAREVMVPRTKVVAFDISTGLDEILTQIQECGHSRYPVFRGSLDHVEGILYAKDLFRVLQQRAGQPVTLAQLIRKPVLFAAETQKISDVLHQMQQRRLHLVVVVDEFGGTGGVLTLEDILEEIVGEIEDEHDDEATRVQEREPGRWLVDATISLWDLATYLGTPLTESIEADSLGGLVTQLAGRVPETGTEVHTESFALKVVEADDRHVTRVEVRHVPQPENNIAQ